MNTTDVKDYSKIIGFSIFSIIKFAFIGLVINWLYGIFKISWYMELFEAGGWWIALALFIIILVFAVIPALFFYMGYQSGIANAISKAFNKNKTHISHLLSKVARKIAGIEQLNTGANLTATANEYRMVRFIINRMGFRKQWRRITKIKADSSLEHKEQIIYEAVDEIVSQFPEKIAAGFSYNLKTVALVNAIALLIIEVISRIYPPAI
jgi:ABC-type multidrug transport system fused ATPase/permease subunit